MGGFKSDEAKAPPQGESLDKDKEPAQLRTTKIHKTRQQSGGFVDEWFLTIHCCDLGLVACLCLHLESRTS